MVKEGVLENPCPQAIFGLHAFAEMAVGEIGYSEGPALSAADTWEVKIVGRQSHGVISARLLRFIVLMNTSGP